MTVTIKYSSILTKNIIVYFYYNSNKILIYIGCYLVTKVLILECNETTQRGGRATNTTTSIGAAATRKGSYYGQFLQSHGKPYRKSGALYARRYPRHNGARVLLQPVRPRVRWCSLLPASRFEFQHTFFDIRRRVVESIVTLLSVHTKTDIADSMSVSPPKADIFSTPANVR